MATLKKTLLTSTPLVLIALALGCSLTGVADFELPECKDDAECREAFNPEHGYYAECAAFRCETRGKRKECVPVSGEIFDGKDNDCDRLIDETDAGEQTIQTEERVIAKAVALLPPQATLARSSGFGEALYYASTGYGFQVPLGEESTDAQAIGFFTQVGAKTDSGTYGSAELEELRPGCSVPAPALASCDLDTDKGRRACVNERQPVKSCNFEDLTAAAGPRTGFFAAVNLEGCTAGELRVGIIDPSSKSQLIARGLGARDPTYRGVSTRGSACSDNGTAACKAAKEAGEGTAIANACGISKPALAASTDQALVAFLGHSASSNECKSSTKVLGLALHEQSAIFGKEYFWSNPSHDGEPDVLGSTNGGAAPAIAALGDRGYLVAFGNDDDELEILFVPSQPRPSALPSPDDLLTFPAYEDRSTYETPPLAGVTQVAKLRETSLVDGVQLALLEKAADRVTVGLSWLDGCSRGGGNSDAHFKLIELDLSEAVPSLAFQSARVELGSSSRAPIVLRSECPFVVSGLSRGGRKATRSDDGGFYVITGTKDLGAQAVRIAAFDGQRVDPNETLSPLPTGSTYLNAMGPGEFLSYSEDQELVLSTFGCSH